jgi:hypothetical protein
MVGQIVVWVCFPGFDIRHPRHGWQASLLAAAKSKKQWHRLVVAVVCDRRERRSQSAATAKKFETIPLPKKMLTAWPVCERVCPPHPETFLPA